MRIFQRKFELKKKGNQNVREYVSIAHHLADGEGTRKEIELRKEKEENASMIRNRI